MQEVNHIANEEETSSKETAKEETNFATQPPRLQHATEEQHAILPAGKTATCRLHSNATNMKIMSPFRERKTLLSHIYCYV